ncbi:hypothetical protein [Qipengyuania sp.]|uniref:hypothetical protein n=1 Tax=Qipengyuania sp. TaxID=2004515 RepID=UPI0035C822F6
MTLVFWFAIAVWLALFAWLGLRISTKGLLAISTVLLTIFAVTCLWAMSGQTSAGWDSGGSFAAGMMIFFAVFVLLGPIAIAFVSRAIGAVWPRFER